MLVLTRRVGESIKVGEDIMVTVMSVQGGQVKIGIDAPKSINIVRTEIIKKFEEQGKEVYTKKPE